MGLQVVADIVGCHLDIDNNGDKKNAPFGRLPYIETSSGEKLGELTAVARYIARTSPNSKILGSNTLERAQID